MKPIQTKLWKKKNSSAKKKQLLAVSDITSNCGSCYPSMAASEENELPPSFSGFTSPKFIHESSYEEVSETTTVIMFLAARSRNRSIVLVNAGLSLTRMIPKQINKGS